MDAGVRARVRGSSQTQCAEIFAYADGQRRRHVAHRMGYLSFEKGIEERVDKREKIGFRRLYRRRASAMLLHTEGQGPTRTAQVDS